jgi:hypothetical protein
MASKNSSPFQERLKKHGVRLGRDLILKSDLKPYINADFFLASIRTVVVRYLVNRRGLAPFAEEAAVLLMNDYSPHPTDAWIRLHIEARAYVISFAEHITQVFHVLDLSLFGVLKRRPRHELPSENENATVKFTMKAYQDFREITV